MGAHIAYNNGYGIQKKSTMLELCFLFECPSDATLLCYIALKDVACFIAST